MTDLVLIATHDQALHAIRAYVDQPGTDPLLRAVVIAVAGCHPADPSMTGRPDPDCFACEGHGSFAAPSGGREHCHCRCPWCLGCEEPLCEGPCPSVEAIAVALGLLPGAPPLMCGAFQPTEPPAVAYRCSEPHDHLGDHVATVDADAVARWAASFDLPEGEEAARPDPFECQPGQPCSDPWCSDKDSP